MTLEGIAALLAVSITCLGILCGATWWASALYSQVCHIAKTVNELQAFLQASLHGQTKINEDIYEKLTDHGQRLSKLER